MRKTSFIAALAALAALGAAGCTTVCNDALYESGLGLSLDSGSVVAQYQLQVEAEGQLLLVDYRIDENNDAICAEECSDHQGNLRIEPRYTAKRGDELSLKLWHVDDWGSGPEKLHVLILRDQVAIHDEAYQPQYRTSEPNGEGCGDVTVARIEIAMTLP